MPHYSGMYRAAAFSAAILAISGCAHTGGRGTRGHRATATAAPVPTTKAKQSTVQSKLTIAGVIAPYENVAITTALNEPVDSVRVLQGDHVSKGQVLAVLNTSDLQAQLAQAQGTLDSNVQNAASADAKANQARFNAKLTISTSGTGVDVAQATLQQAQKTLANDQRNLERNRQLFSQGYLAKQAVDQQQTLVTNDEAAVRSALASVQSARTTSAVNRQPQGLQSATIADAAATALAAHAAIEVAHGQVAQYQSQIQRAVIVSPVDGVVVNRNVNAGEYPASRTLFTVQKLDKVYANLNASSSDTFAIPVGARVALSVSGAGGREYQSTVNAVLGQVTPGSTNFTVQTVVANTDGRLQSGLPVSATISLPPVSGIGIPTTAFLDDSHTGIMTVESNGDETTAHMLSVHERASDKTTSIVTGLPAGTTIVTNGQLGLTDGQSISK